jgi:amino acid transporter
MAAEGLTIKWLAKLNKDSVPGRAMAFDMLLNLCLVFMMPSLLFTLLAGNIGYVLAHILALSGFLLLRRDRPNWPRPLKLGGFWIAAAWLCLTVNIIGTIFGVLYMQYTGYLIKGDDVTGYRGLAIAIFAGLMIIAVVGFIIGQKQAGKKFSFQDKSEEEPAAHAYELMGKAAPSGD